MTSTFSCTDKADGFACFACTSEFWTYFRDVPVSLNFEHFGPNRSKFSLQCHDMQIKQKKHTLLSGDFAKKTKRWRYFKKFILPKKFHTLKKTVHKSDKFPIELMETLRLTFSSISWGRGGGNLFPKFSVSVCLKDYIKSTSWNSDIYFWKCQLNTFRWCLTLIHILNLIQKVF